MMENPKKELFIKKEPRKMRKMALGGRKSLDSLSHSPLSLLSLPQELSLYFSLTLKLIGPLRVGRGES